MKIVSLKSENVKNLRAIEIKPEGGRVVLTGKNGAGKSSVLDSIFIALTGKKPKDLIRHGEEKATIEVDLGRLKVKRVFTRNGMRLEVSNKEGARFQSPQKLLDEITGTLSFDPLAFQRMPQKAQRDLMIKLAGLDFSKSENNRADLYNQRTFKSRILRDLEGEIRRMDAPEEGLPLEEVSVSDSLKELNDLEAKADLHDDALDDLEALTDRRTAEEKLIKGYEDSIKAFKKRIDDARKGLTVLSDQIANFVIPEAVEVETLRDARERLETAEQVNIKIRSAAEYKKSLDNSVSAAEEVEKITKEISEIDAEKEEAIKGASYPVKGLSINDDSVLFKGIPFSQISTGQQIEVSTRIAMSLNPSLKIILIRDGSLLDKAAMKAISKAAKDETYQLWIECLEESGKVGIYIEDGGVVSINGEPVQEKG